MEANEDLLFSAKLAEQAERYDEMFKKMKDFVNEKIGLEKINKGAELCSEEQIMLHVAYKNCIEERRKSWRKLCAIEIAEEKMPQNFLELLIEQKRKIAGEINNFCDDLIDLLERIMNALSPCSEDPLAEPKFKELVYYFTLKGDSFRYKTECSTVEKCLETAEKSHEAYKNAAVFAQNINNTDTTKLMLSLNYSLFFHDILNAPQQACKVASLAFNAAVNESEGSEEELSKESSNILMTLRDNISIWSERLEEKEEYSTKKLPSSPKLNS